MISELTFMALASDQRKLQVHDHPLYPCSAYYTNWKKGFIEGVPWHWHAELEFMIVTEGSVYAEFADRQVLLQAGDGYFCNTKVPHRIRMTGCELCSVHSFVVDGKMLAGGEGSFFYEKYVHPILSGTSFPGTGLLRADPGFREILEHVEAAYAASAGESFGYEYDVRYHLSKALAQILYFFRPEPEEAQQGAGRDLSRIRAMLDYIHTNYGEKLSLSDLADAAGICGREAQRCFSRILHQSPADYLKEYRIQMAQRMLLQSDLSILDIGLAVGMANPSHFCRLFREHTGFTPGGYRRQAMLPG